jgi:hypothetical protein
MWSDQVATRTALRIAHDIWIIFLGLDRVGIYHVKTQTLLDPAFLEFTASRSWMAITNGGSGAGNGTVTFSAAANPTTAQRTGSLTIAGRTVTVTQSGGSCTYSVSPAAQSVARAGGRASFSVTAPSGVPG